MVSDLHSKLILNIENGIESVGTINLNLHLGNSGTASFDVSKVYTDYAKLTSDWFAYLVGSSGGHSNSNPYNGNGSVEVKSVAYDSANGMLTISYTSKWSFQGSNTTDNYSTGLNLPVVVPKA